MKNSPSPPPGDDDQQQCRTIHEEARRLAGLTSNEAYHRALLGHQLQVIKSRKIYEYYHHATLFAYCLAELDGEQRAGTSAKSRETYYRRIHSFYRQDLKRIQGCDITFAAQVLINPLIDERPHSLSVFYDATRKAHIHGARQCLALREALRNADEQSVALLQQMLYGPDVHKSPGRAPPTKAKTGRAAPPIDLPQALAQLRTALKNVNSKRQICLELALLQGPPREEAHALLAQIGEMIERFQPLAKILGGDEGSVAAAPRPERREQGRGADPDPDPNPDEDVVIELALDDLVPVAAAAAEPAEPAEEPAPPQLPESPPRPFADPGGEAVLAVHAHPSLVLEGLTRADHLGYRVLALGEALRATLTEALRLKWQEQDQIFNKLQRLLSHKIDEARQLLDPLCALLEPALCAARADDEARSGEAADYLLEWLLHDAGDPLHEDTYTPSEALLWPALGQLPLLIQDLAELSALRQRGGADAGMHHRLLLQLGALLPALDTVLVKASVNFVVGAGHAEAELAAEAAEHAAVEAAAGPRQSRIIVVGAEQLPPAYGFFGRTQDGRLMAWSFWEPFFALLLGHRGKGKSHALYVFLESLTVRPRGLCHMPRAQCPVLIDADSALGEGRFEMLSGFFPNRDAAQLAELLRFYQADQHNLALKRAVLLCHRKQVAELKVLLAPFVERGLLILPLCLGIADLGGFAFEVMLQWAVGGAEHSVYKNLLQTVVARYGKELTLAMLRQTVQRSNLPSHTKDAVLELFTLLMDYYTETESILQHVGDAPVFVVLRGRFLPTHFVNPMQAVVFNAFCRSTTHGDPPRLVIFEEFAKAMSQNPVLRRFARNFKRELRHRPIGLAAGLQDFDDTDPGLWASADRHVVFGVANPLDIRRARIELPGMRGWSDSDLSSDNMESGEAVVFSRDGNTRELRTGIKVKIRPTLIRTGGRTWNAGDSEDG